MPIKKHTGKSVCNILLIRQKTNHFGQGLIKHHKSYMIKCFKHNEDFTLLAKHLCDLFWNYCEESFGDIRVYR